MGRGLVTLFLASRLTVVNGVPGQVGVAGPTGMVDAVAIEGCLQKAKDNRPMLQHCLWDTMPQADGNEERQAVCRACASLYEAKLDSGCRDKDAINLDVQKTVTTIAACDSSTSVGWKASAAATTAASALLEISQRLTSSGVSQPAEILAAARNVTLASAEACDGAMQKVVEQAEDPAGLAEHAVTLVAEADAAIACANTVTEQANALGTCTTKVNALYSDVCQCLNAFRPALDSCKQQGMVNPIIAFTFSTASCDARSQVVKKRESLEGEIELTVSNAFGFTSEQKAKQVVANALSDLADSDPIFSTVNLKATDAHTVKGTYVFKPPPAQVEQVSENLDTNVNKESLDAALEKELSESFGAANTYDVEVQDVSYSGFTWSGPMVLAGVLGIAALSGVAVVGIWYARGGGKARPVKRSSKRVRAASLDEEEGEDEELEEQSQAHARQSAPASVAPQAAYGGQAAQQAQRYHYGVVPVQYAAGMATVPAGWPAPAAGYQVLSTSSRTSQGYLA
eukprot:TRINITY_DN7128_c0_g1_i1.p1 TRINITY_DN7128_c0_g1~~TRINITY_DN7128_c0_g1_i1.p1  ORF type:complete len:512 (+),score=101.06 TRINITY_DN7128_c0_g1_i1:180-1715(+)